MSEERYKSKSHQPAVKHSTDSVIVCGCTSGSCVRDLVKMDGIINSERYHQSLIPHKASYERCLTGNLTDHLD